MLDRALSMALSKRGFMRSRILSGMRPSGRLHLGNYLGALQNWVTLQGDYECIYCAVDVHALTDMQGDSTRNIQPNIHEMVLDWLAAGIDPNKSTVFVQSHVPEVMILNTLLGMVTPLGWLMRVPTFKDKVRQMQETEEIERILPQIETMQPRLHLYGKSEGRNGEIIVEILGWRGSTASSGIGTRDRSSIQPSLR